MNTPSSPSAIPDPDDMFADSRMSMGDHLEELRKHLLRAIYGFAIGLLVSFFFGQWVMHHWIAGPVEEQLMYYWERFNEKQLGIVVKEIMNGGKLKLPPYRIDANEFASRFELHDENGAKIRLKLVPVGTPLLDPAPGFEALFKMHGLENLGDRKRSAADWIYAYPDVREYVESMQNLNLRIKPPTLATMAPQEAFVVFIKVCMLTGLVISSPWVFYQIWTFIAAGLYPHEKRLVNVYLPYSIGLFIAGVLVCQFLVIPRAIAGLLWFNEWLGLQPDLRLNEWLSFAILMPLVFGISFQTPLVMLFAYTIGVVEIQAFRKFRGIAYFVIAAFAAVILPTPDALSMMLLVGPMWILYEAGIFLCKMRPRIEYEDADSQSQEMIEV